MAAAAPAALAVPAAEPDMSALPPVPDAFILSPAPEREIRASDGCYILLSESLGEALLRKALEEAADAGCTAVFRGLGKGGIKGLVRLISGQSAIPDTIIDPELFLKSGIAGVPAGVWVRDGRIAAVSEGSYSAELLRKTEGFRKAGPVSAVSEPDLLTEIRKRAAGLDASLERRKAVERFLRSVPSWSLPRAEMSMVSARVPRITVPLSLAESHFPFLREMAGKTIDLLPEGGKEDALLAFSCKSPGNAAEIFREAQRRYPDITAACPDYPSDENALRELPMELGTPAFLPRDLAERLGIKALPTLVRTEGKRMVAETFGDGGSDGQQSENE